MKDKRDLARKVAAQFGEQMADLIEIAVDMAVARERNRIAQLLEDAADRQREFGSSIYTQHSESDRKTFAHAEKMLRSKADEVRLTKD